MHQKRLGTTSLDQNQTKSFQAENKPKDSANFDSKV